MGKVRERREKGPNGDGGYTCVDGVFIVRVTAQRPDGTVYRPTRKVKTEREAKKALAELLAQRDKGRLPLDGRITVAQFLPKFLEECERRNLSEKTQDGYETIVRVHLTRHLGRYRLTELRGRHVRSMLTDIAKPKPEQDGKAAKGKGAAGLSPRTVGHVLACLKTALAFAVKQEYVAENVAMSVEAPTVDALERPILTPEQLDTFLRGIAGHRFERVYIAGAFTGARIGEVLALTWQRVSFVERIVAIDQRVRIRKGEARFRTPKGGHTRQVAMSDELLAVLSAERQQQHEIQRTVGPDWNPLELVFARPDGRPFDATTVTKALHKLTDELHLPPINFHDLRHTFASVLIDEDAPIGRISDILGHTKITTTLMIYRHKLRQVDRTAMDLLGGAIQRAKQAGISVEKSS